MLKSSGVSFEKQEEKREREKSGPFVYYPILYFRSLGRVLPISSKPDHYVEPAVF
jgi:hypothetical protein